MNPPPYVVDDFTDAGEVEKGQKFRNYRNGPALGRAGSADRRGSGGGQLGVYCHESKEWKQRQACGTNDAGAWIGGCFVRGLATLKLCSAEFAFSRSGDPRLFDKRGRGRCRIQMRRSCGFA